MRFQMPSHYFYDIKTCRSTILTSQQEVYSRQLSYLSPFLAPIVRIFTLTNELFCPINLMSKFFAYNLLTSKPGSPSHKASRYFLPIQTQFRHPYIVVCHFVKSGILYVLPTYSCDFLSLPHFLLTFC